MLRALVAALLVANLAFYAWSEGWLDDVVGLRSIGDREPERMAREVHPELVRVLPADDAASTLGAAEPAALVCLEAGPFGDADAAIAQAAAQAALLRVNVIDVKTDKPGVWIVYMGRYASREALTKKADELRRRNLDYDEVRDNAELAPGLSLGRFEEQAAAAGALEHLTQQGVRTARVVELAPPSSSHMLRIESADAALAARAVALKLGKVFAVCAKF